MTDKPTSYWQANTVKEAVHILEQERDQVKVLAGGTDYVVQHKEGRWREKSFLDIWKNKELSFIKETDDTIRIGSKTTMDELLLSPVIEKYAKPLHLAAAVFASPQIRNRATLGGNIANGSPAADSVPALYVLNAKVRLKSANKDRIIPIQEFLLSPGKTDRQANELLTEIIIEKMSPKYHVGFYKLGQRNAVAIAIVNLAVCRLEDKPTGTLHDVRIAYGSVAPTVIRAPKTESFLKAHTLDEGSIYSATIIARSEVSPITDIRASAEYRLDMCSSLLDYLLSN